MGDFAEREFAYISKPHFVVSDCFGQHHTRCLDPLRRGKRQVADAICHGGQDGGHL